MLRTGVDLIEIARIRRAAQRHGERFFQRFFTEQERAHCAAKGHLQFEALAGRFAAKEAASKALGTGIGPICWTDIEVTVSGRGMPTLLLHRRAAEIAAEMGLRQWSVSFSHARELAIAFVVATSGEEAK